MRRCLFEPELKLQSRHCYDLRRLEMGQDAYCHIKQIIGEKSSPVLFDVGANVGQIIDILLNYLFPGAVVHGFEPGSTGIRTITEHTPRSQTCVFIILR